MMPGLTGIMINAAPRGYKSTANSMAYVSYNLLGYIPSPVLYGLFTSIAKEPEKSNYGVILLEFVGLLSFIFLGAALYF